ncbi:Pre-mRNA-splicing factor SPF27 [Xylariaceae sp. FL0594]|nr:Pre-mRNA-splicing factor SPF27 [Xylariaceae sp. FL0594]
MASSSSVRTTVHESLPYIDREPTAAEREAAEALINAELSTSTSTSSSDTNTTTTPPSLPPIREPRFSPLIESELVRIGEKKPLEAIDLSRYEIQEEEEQDPSSSSSSSADASLKRAYTSLAYLEARYAHLHLLNSFGSNAWLVANSQLASLLSSHEAELAALRKEIDLVNLQRRRLQVDDDHVGGGGGGVAEELRSLEMAWKKGIDRVLETGLATEDLRRRLLETQRSMAAGTG